MDFNSLITLSVLLICPHLTIICSPTWRNYLARNQYRSDYDVIYVVDEYLDQQYESFFSNEIQALQHRWKWVARDLYWKINSIYSHSTRVSWLAYEFSTDFRRLLWFMFVYQISEYCRKIFDNYIKQFKQMHCRSSIWFLELECARNLEDCLPLRCVWSFEKQYLRNPFLSKD